MAGREQESDCARSVPLESALGDAGMSPTAEQALMEGMKWIAEVNPESQGWTSRAELWVHEVGVLPRPEDPLSHLPDAQRGTTVGDGYFPDYPLADAILAFPDSPAHRAQLRDKIGEEATETYLAEVTEYRRRVREVAERFGLPPFLRIPESGGDRL